MSALSARVLGVALWLFLLSFTFLGLDHAIGDGDEAVHATILRDMLRSGDYLVPRYRGELMLERPFLPYWLAVPGASLLPGEVGIRIASALASFGTLILTFLSARALWRRADAAFVATLLLAGSPSFHAYSRSLLSDPPLVLAFTFALYSTVRARERPRWLIGVGFGLGLAIACKSLIAGVPALALAPWLLPIARRADLRTLLEAALALCVTALPFYVLGYALHGDVFLRAHFGESLGQRAVSHGGIGIPGGYFAFLRWIFEAEGVVALSWLALGSLGALAFGLLRQRRELVLLGSCALGVVAIMSALATRLPHYVLPAYPAAAIGAAGLFAQLSARVGLDRRAFGALLGPALAMAVLLEGRAHPGGDLYLFQRAWGRDLGLLAQRRLGPEQKLYAYDWNAAALAYYSERKVVYLTEHRRRYEVVSRFVKPMLLVPPAPEPVGSVIYAAGPAPVLHQSRWLAVDEVLGFSPPMFLVKGHVIEPGAPER